MKYLALILTIFLFACSVQRVHENTLYVTRAYVGIYVDRAEWTNGCKVFTDRHLFFVIGRLPNIPNNAKCYIQLKRIKRLEGDFYRSYFAWDGTDSLYLLRQNVYNAKPY